MAESVLAAVRVGPSKTEIREYPMPDVPADGAVRLDPAGAKQRLRLDQVASDCLLQRIPLSGARPLGVRRPHPTPEDASRRRCRYVTEHDRLKESGAA